MKLKSWAKTSGSKGLQVYVPLNTAVTYDQTKELSHAIAEHLEREHPEAGRFQNGESAAQRKNLRRLEPERRAQDHDLRLLRCARERQPTASTPVTWEEVEATVKKKNGEELGLPL